MTQKGLFSLRMAKFVSQSVRRTNATVHTRHHMAVKVNNFSKNLCIKSLSTIQVIKVNLTKDLSSKQKVRRRRKFLIQMYEANLPTPTPQTTNASLSSHCEGVFGCSILNTIRSEKIVCSRLFSYIFSTPFSFENEKL